MTKKPPLPDQPAVEVLPAIPAGKKALSLAEILPLREKGLSLAQIGAILGVSKQAVSQALQRAGAEAGTVERFRKDRPAILALTQKRLLDSVKDADIEKMAVRDRFLAMGICFDKETAALNPNRGSTIINILQIADRMEDKDESL